MKTYVIFQFRYRPYIGKDSKKYTIVCQNKEQAKEIASDAYFYDGISYLKITSNKRNLKGRIVLDAKDYNLVTQF